MEEHCSASEGWSKGPAQILLADSGELRSEPTHPDHPSSVDFLEEVPGEEFKLIVINTGAEIIEATESRMVVNASVIRDTILEFNPGRLLHILNVAGRQRICSLRDGH